jgi:flagellar basal body rod protein FlgB
MNLASLATDNITELLIKIVKFTRNRQKILTDNVNNVHKPGFIPMDLPADEFSDLMNHAISEHIINQRLVLCDSDNVKFGHGGSFEVKPIVDEYAKSLLEDSHNEYLGQQIDKLLENSLNQRVACELIKQRTEGISIF